jgi:hypothetical protein
VSPSSSAFAATCSSDALSPRTERAIPVPSVNVTVKVMKPTMTNNPAARTRLMAM